MTNQILFVDKQRKNEIDSLRMHAYQNSSGFTVDLSTLKWKDADDESFVMAVELNNQLVSTMRGEVISELTVLEQKLECLWQFPLTLEMPIILLSRAATLSTYRASGFNLLLRYWFIRFAMSHKIPFMLGTFTSGSPRENTLKEMGFKFFENELGWQQSTYRSSHPVVVVALDLNTDGEKALDYCQHRLHEVMKQFHLRDSFPNLRIVRSL